MTDQIQAPTRLLDDPSLAANLHGDLELAVQHGVAYDLSAGLARFEGSLAAGASAASPVAAGFAARALGWVVGASVLVGGSIGAMQLVDQAQAQRMHDGVVVQTPTPTPAPQQGIEPETGTRTQHGEVAHTPSLGAGAALAAPGDSVVEAQADPQSEDAGIAAAKSGGNDSNSSAAPPRPSSSLAPAGGSLADEARQINEARRALTSDPAKALAITEQAAKSFPKGAMVQEREGYAILALAALGRDGEAHQRAQRYLERWPKGPLSSRVEALLSP